MIDYPKLALIVARSKNNVIGVDGDLPWRLSSDLAFFKRTTLGKPVLMGRKTWESLPFALPKRPNLVLTRNEAYRAEKAEVFTSIHDMIARGYEWAGWLNTTEIMIIGGGALYDAVLPLCHRMYITDVDITLEGDTHFPTFSHGDWYQVSEHPVSQTQRDDYPFTIRVFDRK